eukprot:scaffold156_cov308-Prasinococcus_capsulatus_cf.AAC.8
MGPCAWSRGHRNRTPVHFRLGDGLGGEEVERGLGQAAGARLLDVEGEGGRLFAHGEDALALVALPRLRAEHRPDLLVCSPRDACAKRPTHKAQRRVSEQRRRRGARPTRASPCAYP